MCSFSDVTCYYGQEKKNRLVCINRQFNYKYSILQNTQTDTDWSANYFPISRAHLRLCEENNVYSKTT